MTPYYDDGTCQIIHGDCREVLPDLTADVVIADPPYGIALDTDYRRFGERTNRTWVAIEGDGEAFDPAHLLAVSPCVLFGANYYSNRLPVGRWVVWNKRDQQATGLVLADAELIWHNLPGRSVQVFNWYWNGCYRKGEMGTAYHPTQKPLALMSWLVEQFSQPGELILDPYMGSGTTLRAAKDLGRKAIGIEIEERYCEVAAKRLGQEVLAL